MRSGLGLRSVWAFDRKSVVPSMQITKLHSRRYRVIVLWSAWLWVSILRTDFEHESVYSWVVCLRQPVA